MIWPFGVRSKLLRELDKLAFYNDKGIAYSRHNDSQVESERSARTARIQQLVAAIGQDCFPSAFLEPLSSGLVATDMTGAYHRLVKDYFRNRSAP
ncbi:MAG: hypothetical protein EON58_07335 [Alphaproteobacteria bacterium]|nr:MAG: hypothetical protein EON58_07335 [Alphaproteobacteria bacterium]